MKLCTRCIIPDSMPDAHFESVGNDYLCDQCRIIEKNPTNLNKLKREWDKFVDEAVIKNSEYSAIFALSGGKDSIFALKLANDDFLLKNKKILAVTVNTGFKGEKALTNIKNITKKLEIDWQLIDGSDNAIDLVKEDIRNKRLSCDYMCAKIMVEGYKKIAKIFGSKNIIGGWDVPFTINNQEPTIFGSWCDEYTFVSVIAAYGYTVDDIYKTSTLDLGWNDPTYGGYDSDCILPGVQLALIAKDSNKSPTMFEMDDYIENENLRHVVWFLAEKVRKRNMTRECALEEIACLKIADRDSLYEMIKILGKYKSLDDSFNGLSEYELIDLICDISKQ